MIFYSYFNLIILSFLLGAYTINSLNILVKHLVILSDSEFICHLQPQIISLFLESSHSYIGVITLYSRWFFLSVLSNYLFSQKIWTTFSFRVIHKWCILNKSPILVSFFISWEKALTYPTGRVQLQVAHPSLDVLWVLPVYAKAFITESCKGESGKD